MATLGKVASRYAKALFDDLKGKKQADAVLAELERFAKIATEHQELRQLISSPGFSIDEKTGVVADIASKMEVSKEASQILRGLSHMGRLDQLTGILQRLRVRLLENEGVQPIQVSLAASVAEEDRKHIETKFEKLLGKKVEATYDTDTRLVGGLRVVAGGRTYDGSLAGWLDSLQESLVEGEA